MKIRIIAGGDRTGKSTLCKYFSDNGYTYVHFGPPVKSPYLEYQEFIDNILEKSKNSNENIIIDRYMYCEFAYSKHYNRPTDMTIDKMHKIEKTILKIDPNAFIIYCENDIDENWKLIQDEGKNEFKNKQEVINLRDTYRDVLYKTHLSCLVYNYNLGWTPSQIFNITNNALN